MYKAVEVICSENEQVWGNISIIREVFDDFKKQLGVLDEVAQEQSKSTKGAQVVKQTLRTEVRDTAVSISKMIQAYASVVGNEAFFHDFNYSNTSFDSAKESDVKIMARKILHTGKDNFVQLEDYGLKQDTLDDFEKAINNYSEKASVPRVIISNRKEATTHIKILFGLIDGILKDKLDKLMYRFNDTSFYGAYKAARMIINR
jgi:hypothetical protein